MDYRIEHRRYRLRFRVPVRTAHGPWFEREGLLVRLEGADGRVGYGEAAPLESFIRESVEDDESVCRSLGGFVRADQIDSIPAGYPALRNALASAKNRTDPKATPAFPVAALLPSGRACVAIARDRCALGFRTFKWKVGVADAADERILLDDLLAQLPSGSRVRLDANGAWDRRCAEKWLSFCADRPVEYVEQPVPAEPDAEDLLVGLSRDYPVPIALDESAASQEQIIAWIERSWPGVYVIKPSLLADPAAVMARLSAAGADVVFSSALETAVGARSALAYAFAWSGPRRALGFGVWPLFEDARFDGPALAPFFKWEDVASMNPESVWNALS
jgi:O-succinylbenzoate synthase